MSMSVFDIRDTPIVILDHVGAKYNMMRLLGTNDWSSVTCGIIEALLQNQQTKSLSYLRPYSTYGVISLQGTKDLIKLLEQLTQPHMTLKYFYDSLRKIDRSNITLGNYIMDQIKQRFNCAIRISLDQNSLRHFVPQFNVVLYLSAHDGTKLTINPQGSIPVVIYQAREGNYYCFQNNYSQSTAQKTPVRATSQAPNLSQSLVQPRCQMCQKPNSQMYTNTCNHVFCIPCLDKAFIQGYTTIIRTIKCSKAGCAGIIEKSRYLDFKNPNRTTQSTLFIAPTPPSRYYCVKCFLQYDKSKVFVNQQCKHALCEDCVLAITAIQMCQERNCPCRVDTVAFNDYKNSLKRQRNIGQQEIIQKQPQNPIIEETPRCDACFKQYKPEAIYVNQCGHQICKICADKQISKQQSRFKCYDSICRADFDCQEIQKYFYQKIQEENQLRCVICAGKFTPYNVFKIDKCTHCICFDCIAKKALEGRLIAYCPVCSYNRIDQDKLEAFYIQRQTDMIEQIERSQMEVEPQQISKDASRNGLNGSVIQEQKEAQPKREPSDSTIAMINGNEQQKLRQKDQMEVENIYDRCSNCGSRINEYNLQIEVNCKKGHQLGTCCVPDDDYCTQCKNKGAEFEDQKLHLAFRMKMGSTYYEKESFNNSSILSKRPYEPYSSGIKRYI